MYFIFQQYISMHISSSCILGAEMLRICVGRRFATALLPRQFGKNPRSHHKGATSRVRTGNQRLPVLCHCQLGQDKVYISAYLYIFGILKLCLFMLVSCNFSAASICIFAHIFLYLYIFSSTILHMVHSQTASRTTNVLGQVST